MTLAVGKSKTTGSRNAIEPARGICNGTFEKSKVVLEQLAAGVSVRPSVAFLK
jgi:hypothetical protein